MIADATRYRVIERYRQGETEPGKLALSLNLSLTTVNRALREGGVKQEHAAVTAGKKMRAETAPDVRRLAESGTSPTQICKELRLGYDTLLKIAAEHSIALPEGKTGRHSKYDQKIGEIKRLAAAGLSQSEIAHRTSVPMPTLSRWLDQAGIVVPRSPGRTKNASQAEHFGATEEERQEAASRGGLASTGDAEVICLYCKRPFTHGRTGSGRITRDRFCSREHAYAHRRENSGKTITVTCECGCGEQFLTWAGRPKKYLSREHWIKSNRKVPEYGYEGHVIQGGHEAAFIGLCSLRGIAFEFFDRTYVISWDGEESGYGPDFVIRNGTIIYVDTKGWQKTPAKWQAFREQRGPLAILRKKDLDELFLLPTTAQVLAAIRAKATEQGAK